MSKNICSCSWLSYQFHFKQQVNSLIGYRFLNFYLESYLLTYFNFLSCLDLASNCTICSFSSRIVLDLCMHLGYLINQTMGGVIPIFFFLDFFLVRTSSCNWLGLVWHFSYLVSLVYERSNVIILYYWIHSLSVHHH